MIEMHKKCLFAGRDSSLTYRE